MVQRSCDKGARVVCCFQRNYVDVSALFAGCVRGDTVPDNSAQIKI